MMTFVSDTQICLFVLTISTPRSSKNSTYTNHPEEREPTSLFLLSLGHVNDVWLDLILQNVNKSGMDSPS